VGVAGNPVPTGGAENAGAVGCSGALLDGTQPGEGIGDENGAGDP
jgi:hypothetical protein